MAKLFKDLRLELDDAYINIRQGEEEARIIGSPLGIWSITQLRALADALPQAIEILEANIAANAAKKEAAP